MRFISFICIFFILISFSCRSQDNKDIKKGESNLNDYILDFAKRTPPLMFDLKTTELGIIQITGILNEEIEGEAYYITSENETWFILFTEENLNNLYGKNITVEGEGFLIGTVRTKRELRKAKVLEVHDRVDI